MVVNHRPNFPFYTSNGYAVFLPDIHFEVGIPGYSATKSLVPGMQKLIDMGVAEIRPDTDGQVDPMAIFTGTTEESALRIERVRETMTRLPDLEADFVDLYYFKKWRQIL